MRADKAGKDGADEEFEWDMTAALLIVMLIVFVVAAAMSFGPLGHTR